MVNSKPRLRIAVIGGGAAGYFGAIAAAEKNRDAAVTLFEATASPLDKVRISGGGRCNVTHACFDPKLLADSYPRGGRELIGPFNRFQPSDTVDWFLKRGVQLKREDDGRMFPTTDSSDTIITCLKKSASNAGVITKLQSRVLNVARSESDEDRAGFEVRSSDEEARPFDRILLATGSSPQGYRIAGSLGHNITPLAPSLFTFKIRDPRLEGLSGVSFKEAALTMQAGEASFSQSGPVLITHWGLSGPAVLKLSARGARSLKEAGYKASLRINWLLDKTSEEAIDLLNILRRDNPKKAIRSIAPDEIPKRFWERIVGNAGISDDITWANATRRNLQDLAACLTHDDYHIMGKGIFKEEFVTCGGVDLREIDFKTMQSKVQPGLFFAGEILDIDGITGGFNFQAAWTTGWIAGQHIADQ